MVVIASWLLALTKIKIPIELRGDPIKSLLYMPGGHSMTIIFLINMLGGPIKSPINMRSDVVSMNLLALALWLWLWPDSKSKFLHIYLDESGSVFFPSGWKIMPGSIYCLYIVQRVWTSVLPIES